MGGVRPNREWVVPRPPAAAIIRRAEFLNPGARDSAMSPKKKPYCYEYPRPSVTVDMVIVTRERRPRVLLIRRKHEPFEGKWAIPGGYVEMDESLEAAARRELREETGVEVAAVEQLYTFGDPGRDPRGRTISVAYLARVREKDVHPEAAD